MAVLLPVWILLTALLALPVLVFLVEVLAAMLPRPVVQIAGSGEEAGPRTVVLIPAHDEEAGIGATLRVISQGLGPQDHMLVVADNCSDATARVAREAGAQVVERNDPVRRGKSFALEHGIEQLRATPPDVITIVDADCIIDKASLRVLSRHAFATQRPVQALYLMQAPPELGFGGRIAEFAWLVKNEVRPLGMKRLGGACHLTGSGMSFPWPLIAGAQLASGHLVEDMQLGIELAAAGAAPRFLPEARVFSQFAANAAGASSQRTRWEHGHLQIITSSVPQLLWQALRTGNWKLFGLALDLSVPPLALLVMLSLGSLGVSALLTRVPGVPDAVLLVPAVALLLLVLAVLLAWVRFGRQVVPFQELLGIPFYILRKVPLYLRFMTARQKGWVRSQRDDRPPE
jgi:cellulose synthase/poly-beta-1,6-N-acetylglucosamine synthase-like glycosyltransferase